MDWLVCAGLQLNGKCMAMPENPVNQRREGGRRRTGDKERGKGEDEKRKEERERKKERGRKGKRDYNGFQTSSCHAYIPQW